MRTIIDILRKGNQELFHSSMIAWLLDPKREHGLGSILLDGIGAKLDAKGFSGFKQVMGSKTTVDVLTEVTRSKSRYDIEIHVGDALAVVLENKTKSVGEEPQLAGYSKQNPDAILVALGLCKESFSHDVEQRYPLITYGDVLEILQHASITSNDWGVLVKHYILFLEREISILELMSQCYEKGDMTKHDELVGIICKLKDVRTENDSRFLNLFLLEKFRRRLAKNRKFDGYQWHSNKNHISGVWLANYESQPTHYHFTDEIRTLQERNSAKMWFHIELGRGILAEDLTDAAGTFQLKAWTEKDNRRLLEEFRQIRTSQPDEGSPKKVNEKSDTFYLVSKKICKQEDLILNNLEANFTSFCESFGAFS